MCCEALPDVEVTVLGFILFKLYLTSQAALNAGDDRNRVGEVEGDFQATIMLS